MLDHTNYAPVAIDFSSTGGGLKVFFFGYESGEYVRYDVARNEADPGYPKPIEGNWPGLADVQFNSKLDAVVNLGNGKLCFFRGDSYVQYDIALNRMDAGYPKRIKDNWPGVLDNLKDALGNPFSKVTAATHWGGNTIFFFVSDSYVEYDLHLGKTVAAHPFVVPKDFHLPASGFRAQSWLSWGGPKAFAFDEASGLYVQIDTRTKIVDPGYPKPIAGNWIGLVGVVGGTP
jgi:hypothetical protein